MIKSEIVYSTIEKASQKAAAGTEWRSGSLPKNVPH
jgi:hypothetical protein